MAIVKSKKISKERKNKFNYWPYVLFAGIVLILAAFAPYLFANLSWGIVEFGEKTGPIGDTIGGITAPFLSLVGSILVFAALRAQIQANNIVLEQFDREKEDVRLESLNKIELLSIDMDSVIKDIELRAERMKTYFENERERPFEMNLMKRTSSRVYSRIVEFERLAIYKGFKEFKAERDEWIPHYNMLYRVFDFLPDFFKDLYEKHDSHVKDIFAQKNGVRASLIDLMNLSAKFLEQYKTKYPMLKPESDPVWSATNELILKYQEVINESFNEVGEIIKETDFDKISNDVLLEFISTMLGIRKAETKLDSETHQLIELSANTRRDIQLIKERAFEFSKNIEEQHKKLVLDEDNQKSTLFQIKKVKEFIDCELTKISN